MPSAKVRCPDNDRFHRGFAEIRDELDVPASFSDEVLEAATDAAAAGPMVPDAAPGDVRDRTDLPFVAIDPPGSTDLDQAFTAETRTGGGFRVFYAIADVAAFVRPDGPVDVEARRRGLTLYSPDERTSLHPEAISEGAGSLLADQTRRALLWTIDLDDDAEIVDAHLERADVRNRAQLTYREAQAIIENDPDDPLTLLREVGTRRLRLEEQRGAVSLRLPTQEVVNGDDGVYQLAYDETLPVESWNAQISLLTGIAAASIMLEAGVGLLRTLPPPDGRTVSQLRRTARALDIEWPDSVDYATRIRSLEPNDAASAALLAQSARGLRGAGYVAFRDGQRPKHPEHSAIASTYAHVTAPLRRLCDRFANEILVAACADTAPPSWAVEALDELPSIMGKAKGRDRALERAVVDYVEAVVLEPRVGQRFHAVVTDLDDDGGRVQLRDPAVVARIDGDGLDLGQELDVELVAADPGRRRVLFEPAR